ncbi:sulfotransferase domain-containing protein [Numidum massiliense]|uniref:sulfotransferase domain-containing protein n=1 Tax=Numidum massiliense TaxID=1522315 RepID=UPI000B2128CC|nr:sulfotransferase domain-containing protein [Numidum massiliense]
MNQTIPDFLIIGVQKGGTTSLYRYLSQHPRIVPAPKKEMHFFDYQFKKGMDWYRKQFKVPSNKNKRRVLAGEATPYYMAYPHTAARIKETAPHVKLIVLLRNPVDRAYSHYYHEVKRKHEPLSFREAITREKERLRGERKRMVNDHDYQSVNYRRYSYLQRGKYITLLKPWLELFPREQFLFIKSETFFCRPQETLAKVTSFLGLPKCRFRTDKVHQKGNYEAPLPPNIKKQLQRYFKPYNEKLYETLGIDFGWDSYDEHADRVNKR